MVRGDLFKYAYAMAYVTLFSLVPSLAVIFSLTSLFLPFVKGDGGQNVITAAREFILEHLAAGSGETVINYLESFLANIDMKKIGLTGFAGMVFTLILLLKQIESALNRVFMVNEERHMLVRFIYFWTILTLGTFVASLGFGIVSDFDLSTFIPFLTKKSQLPSVSNSILASVFGPVAVFSSFTFLYKVVPNCRVKLRAAAIGALVATALLLIGTRFYTGYTARFTNYTAVYGALAAVPIFLFWIYVLWLITLFGSVVTWRAQEGFTKRLDDGYVGAQKPVERLRSHQLQNLVPFILLVAVLDRFHNGDGAGVTGKDLAIKLNLPEPWVAEGLEVLLELGHVYRKQTATASESPTIFEESLFPTRPAERIALRHFESEVTAGATLWLEQWRYDWGRDLKEIVLRRNAVAGSSATTFGDLLSQT